MKESRLDRRQFLGSVAAGVVASPEIQLAKEQEPFKIYFPETGHNVGGVFLSFFRRYRRLLGLPISEPFQDQEGRLTQCFENTWLAHHPEYHGTAYEVLIPLLGQELVPNSLRATGVEPLNKEFFHKHGGSDFFGPPVSHLFSEGGKQSQYTQRFLLSEQEVAPERQFLAPFRHYQTNKKWYPRLLWPGKTTVAPLGRIAAEQYGIDTAQVNPDADAILYSSAPGSKEKRVEVNIPAQTLTAYEGDIPVLHTLVSTGAPGFNTPRGRFRVLEKIPVMDYRSPFPQTRPYFLPDVPWNLRIVSSVLIHGAYWHDGFGEVRSAGCINLNLDDAFWMYQWAPVGIPVLVR